MLRRHPTDLAPAKNCWARYRGDDDCAVCPWQEHCQQQTRNEPVTVVAEAISLIRTTSYQITASALSAHAVQIFADISPTASTLRWVTDSRFLAAMQKVIDACAKTDVDPRQYVRAQLQMLRPLIEKRVKIRPAHFLGVGANSRWDRWSETQQRRHGMATTSHSDSRKTDRRLAACLLYATERGRGEDHATALYRAHDIDLSWDGETWTEEQRLKGLSAAVATVSPEMPFRVVAPENWNWDTVTAFCKSFRDDEETDVPLGEDDL